MTCHTLEDGTIILRLESRLRGCKERIVGNYGDVLTPLADWGATTPKSVKVFEVDPSAIAPDRWIGVSRVYWGMYGSGEEVEVVVSTLPKFPTSPTKGWVMAAGVDMSWRGKVGETITAYVVDLKGQVVDLNHFPQLTSISAPGGALLYEGGELVAAPLPDFSRRDSNGEIKRKGVVVASSAFLQRHKLFAVQDTEGCKYGRDGFYSYSSRKVFPHDFMVKGAVFFLEDLASSPLQFAGMVRNRVPVYTTPSGIRVFDHRGELAVDRLSQWVTSLRAEEGAEECYRRVTDYVLNQMRHVIFYHGDTKCFNEALRALTGNVLIPGGEIFGDSHVVEKRRKFQTIAEGDFSPRPEYVVVKGG